MSATDLSPNIFLHTGLLACAVLASAFVPGIAVQPQSAQIGKLSAFGGLREVLSLALVRRVVLVAALVYGSHAMHDTFAVIRWNAA